MTEAIQAAEKFIADAKLAEQRPYYNGKFHEWIEPGSQMAACKRSSMELTKLLAKIRRPST